MDKEKLVEKIISDILKSKKFEGRDGRFFYFDNNIVVSDYEEVTKDGIQLVYLSSYTPKDHVDTIFRENLKQAIKVKTSVFIKDYMAS